MYSLLDLYQWLFHRACRRKEAELREKVTRLQQLLTEAKSEKSRMLAWGRRGSG